jgi:hypothetical protein
MPLGTHRPPIQPPPEITLHHKDDRIQNFSCVDWWVRTLLMAILLVLVVLCTDVFVHGQQGQVQSVGLYWWNGTKYVAVNASNPLPVSATVSGSNPCASATGSAVPADACWGGLNISGNLAGWTGFTVGSQNAAAVAIVDGSGNQITSFGGGTQYTQGTTQASPVGTVAMGINPSNVINALNQDASGNLNVNLNANSFGTITVAGSTNVFKVSPTTSANSASNPFFDQLTDGTNAIGAFANYGTSPGAVKVPGVNAYITNTPAVSGSGVFEVGPTTSANTSTNPFFNEVTDGTNVMGAMANFGTSPGAVKSINSNASIMVGTTVVRSNQTTTATGVVDVNVVGALGSTMSATHPIFSNITDGTTALSAAVSAWGTAPTGTEVLGVNAKEFGNPNTSSATAATSFHVVGSTSTYNTVKSGAGNLYGGYVYNPNASVCYLVFYNSTAPTIGTTTIIYAFGLPATSGFTLPPQAIALANFSTGITIAGTTTDGGSTVCSTGMSVNLWYE